MGNFHFDTLRTLQVTKKDGDLPVRDIDWRGKMVRHILKILQQMLLQDF